MSIGINEIIEQRAWAEAVPESSPHYNWAQKVISLCAEIERLKQHVFDYEPPEYKYNRLTAKELFDDLREKREISLPLQISTCVPCSLEDIERIYKEGYNKGRYDEFDRIGTEVLCFAGPWMEDKKIS